MLVEAIKISMQSLCFVFTTNLKKVVKVNLLRHANLKKVAKARILRRANLKGPGINKVKD